MTGVPQIGWPESRPAMRAVAALPMEWKVTGNSRALLLALAADSYDGHTCAPGRDALLQATGLWVSQYRAAVDDLTRPQTLRSRNGRTIERPALLAVHRSRFVEFELLFVDAHGEFTDPRHRRGTATPPTPATPSQIPDGPTSDHTTTTPSRNPDGPDPVTPSHETVARNRRESPTPPFPSDLKEGGKEAGGSAPDGAAPPPHHHLIDTVTAALTRQPAWAGLTWNAREPRLLDVLHQLDHLDRGDPDLIAAAIATIPAPNGSRPATRSRLIAAHLDRELVEQDPRAVVTQPGRQLTDDHVDHIDQWARHATITATQRRHLDEHLQALALTVAEFEQWDDDITPGAGISLDTPVMHTRWEVDDNDDHPTVIVALEDAIDGFPEHLRPHHYALGQGLTHLATGSGIDWQQSGSDPYFTYEGPHHVDAVLDALRIAAAVHAAADALAQPTGHDDDRGCPTHGWDDTGQACRGCRDARDRRHQIDEQRRRDAALLEARERQQRHALEAAREEQERALGVIGPPPPDVVPLLRRNRREATA